MKTLFSLIWGQCTGVLCAKIEAVSGFEIYPMNLISKTPGSVKEVILEFPVTEESSES